MLPLHDPRAEKGSDQDPGQLKLGTPNAENEPPYQWEESVPRGSRAREHATGHSTAQHGLHGISAAALHQPAHPASLRHPVTSCSHPPFSSTAAPGTQSPREGGWEAGDPVG